MHGFFDMSIKHGAVGPDSHFVSSPMNLKPFLSFSFVFANLVTDFWVEDFSATSRKTPESDIHEFLKDFLDAHFGEELEPVDFYRRPGFQVE